MPSEVQILKESKARFEGVIFDQTADLGTNKSTSCKVIDEATGEVIAQSGSGGESEFVKFTLELTVGATSQQDPPILSGPIINQDGTLGGFLPLSSSGTAEIKIASTTGESGAAKLLFIHNGDLDITTTTEDAVAINEATVYVFADNGKLTVAVK